jgi:hypothetical protein
MMLAAPAIGASAPVDWAESIRQCWNDSLPNRKITCYLTEGQFRLSRSAKDCLVEAIKSVREDNDPEAAVRWILACHCGTDREDAKQAIQDHKDDALRFLLDVYGGLVQ